MLNLKMIYDTYPQISKIVPEIANAGGTAYLVGGAVRDLLLGILIHDLDIEVHGLTMEQLSDLLSKHGIVNLVGKSFGVLKMYGTPIDWSLPRSDSSGRKPEVIVNPHMGIKHALVRRDLTMNAMAIDLTTHKLIDPFNGYEDLKNRVLRSPDSSFFCEDPLRFYRVMQFIGRFEMEPDQELNSICKQMDISKVSKERIEDEFEKLLLKSKRPSLGFRWLEKIGRIHEILPELADTINVKQDTKWHPEGSVFEHLMQTVDAAVVISKIPQGTSLDSTNTLNERAADELVVNDRLILLYAALCHDLGKAITTILVDGIIKSPGHAQAGVPLARALLKRITLKVKIMSTVGVLVNHHMDPAQFTKQKSKLSAYRRLALKLAKYTTIEMLSRVALADQRGRNPRRGEPLTTTPGWFYEFVKKAQKAEVFDKPETPVIRGKDIADIVPPGKEMGRLLAYAYELQLEHGIKSKHELRTKIVELIKR